jgi:NLR family CARD domain-containing protein 3
MKHLRDVLISNSLRTLQLNFRLNDDLEELAGLLKDNSSVVSVEISTSEVFCCEKLMAVFERKQNILTYQLGNISQHGDLERFGEMMVRNGSIVNLKFSSCNFDSEAIKIISSTLSTIPTIQSLAFCRNNISSAGLERLMEAASCIHSLTKLHFSFNNPSISVHSITRFVSDNDTLTELCILYSQYGAGMKEMVRVLQNNNNIQILDLSSNFMGKDSGAEIAALLGTNSHITDLNIGGNHIGDDGVILICERLLRNSSITRINLSHNLISFNGAKHIADVMTINSSVIELVLSNNEGISDKGAKHLAHMLTHNSTISTLLCFGCGFGETGLISMAAAINTTLQCIGLSDISKSTASVIALAEALAVNSTLTTVKLPRMGIDAVGVRELCQGLQRNGSISSIDLSVNRFGDEGARCIAALLESNSVISSLDVSYCNITDEGARVVAALAHNTSITEFRTDGNLGMAFLKDEIESLVARNMEIKQCHFSLK